MGIDYNDIPLLNYVVYLKYCIKPKVYYNKVEGYVDYDISAYANFVDTIKINNKRTCNICCNKKQALNHAIDVNTSIVANAFMQEHRKT